MKLLKKEKEDVLKVYDTWLYSYLNGDVKTYDSFLDDEYRFIGSTDNEDFLNRKDTTKFFENTADQLAGQVEIRNSRKTFEKFNELIFITDLFDAYFLNANNWEYYGKFRFTSSLRKQKIGWRFVYQHFSTPDTKAQEGETIGTEQIAAENLQLREAIKRRTTELENKSQELEIEASLERVRTVAMSMRKPDDMLDVCRIISEQLQVLNVKDIRNVQTAIINEQKGTYLNYQYFTAYSKSVVEETEYNKNPLVNEMVNELKRSADAYFTGCLEGEELISFREYRKLDKQFPDPLLDKATKAHYNFYSIGLGGLGLTTYKPLPEAGLEIFKRFHNVFKLAYSRFIDIQQAEAQAREAKIEASLERVRSRAMAMHNSDELLDAGTLLYQELTKLGIESVTSGYVLVDEENKIDWNYTANPANQAIMPVPVGIPNNKTKVMRSINASWKVLKPYLSTELDPKETINHQTFVAERSTNFPISAAELIAVTPERLILNNFNFKQGYLLIVGGRKLVNEQIEIMLRFTKVFAMTYRRFLDLKQAEAQAKEAQIEVSLERVRSKTMAMHKSDELQDAAVMLFQQVEALGLQIVGCGFNIWDDDRNAATAWMSGLDRIQPPFKTSSKEDIFLRIYEAAQRGESLFVEEQSGKELENHYKYMASIPVFKKILNQLEKQGLSAPSFQIMHCAFFSHGYLMFITSEPVIDAYDLFKRFAKVFEQTYTRFLDLQKAEAQAREGQIELALERVRARTMAMQHSNELADASFLLVQQVKALGINTWGCAFNIFDENQNSSTEWFSNDEGSLPMYKTPRKGIFLRYYKAGQRGETLHIEKIEGKVCQDHYEFLCTLPVVGEALIKVKESGIPFPTSQIDHVAYFKYGYLLFITFEPVPKAHEIFKRFAKVFEQTYTRFLDLQKAEAQAMEAQIELALERIRAQAMAMNESSDLLDIVVTMRTEFIALGHEAHYFWHMRWLPEMYQKAMTSGDGTRIGMVMTLPRHIHGDIKLVDQWEKGKKPSLIFPMDIETAVNYVDKMINLGDFELVDPNAPTLDDVRHIGGLTFIMARTTHGEIGYSLPGNVPNPPTDGVDTLTRFAGAFDLAYKRFEDIKEAEAQAREAQIEAALERTRTQSMFMQHSNEIKSISNVFHEQLLLLGIPSEFSYVWLPDETKDEHQFWATWAEEKKGSLLFKSKAVTYPLDKTEAYTAACFSAWESDELVHVSKIQAEEVEKFFTTWKELLRGAKKLKTELFPDGLYYAEAYMKYGCFGINIRRELTNNEKQILLRFTIEFERAYTRFLDLQKAEAQTRESQIEVALERVRGRSLAMHQSNELNDVAYVLFQQLKNLGGNLWGTGFGLFNDEGDEDEFWFANEKGIMPPVMIPHKKDPIHKKIYEGWKNKIDFYSESKEKIELKAHYDYMLSLPDVKPFFQGILDAGLAFPDWQQWNAAYFSHGCLLIITIDPYHDEQILKRFAKVFEQAYIRFLDLQRAEIQTYKANIEVALERVRARALAMHQPEELIEVAEVLRYEMGLLGVEELETSSIYINKANQADAECWFALKDIRIPEKQLLSDHFKLAYHETWVGRQMFDFHLSDKNEISIAMKGENRKEWIDYCSKQSTNFEGYYGDIIPERTYHLCKFSNGAVGAATPGNISAESWELLRRAASVFSLAYSRFKDLTKARFDLQLLKTEKRRAEEALTELKATQSQLIQAEKMASLGELTAGIAHEIQNPLNFVNNFSEVNSELISELVIELKKEIRDAENEDMILNDIKENEQKINHHGKRASNIVKGMLEHSRASDGKRELTDINTLADEYLRLAYHGLRAKDKNFNADFKTDLDKSLPKINIVQQDIGRVLLNLINNAFHACTERSRIGTEQSRTSTERSRSADDKDFKPLITVSTLNGNDELIIKVKDNGNGIPESIKEKIFQPFFTTKPTGQGTGLGLSLSYDIIKAHGGELKVETRVGEGAAFIIHLPI
jgi:signal transduction histidine kinase